LKRGFALMNGEKKKKTQGGLTLGEKPREV
jgi:hypothetical protein